MSPRSLPTHLITAQTATGEALQAALVPLEGQGTSYLHGTFEAPGSRATLPRVEVARDRVTLHYGTPEGLEAWRGRALRGSSASLCRSTKPRREAPPPPASITCGGPAVHPLLEPWVR